MTKVIVDENTSNPAPASSPPSYEEVPILPVPILQNQPMYSLPPTSAPPSYRAQIEPVYAIPIEQTEYAKQEKVVFQEETHYLENVEKCGNLLGNCLRTIFCFWTNLRCMPKNRECSFLLIILTLVFFSIFIGLYVGIVQKDKNYVDPYIQTSCQYLSQQEILYRCCNQVNCQCLQAPSNAPTCSSALASLNATTSCGIGYQCCHTHCDSCPIYQNYDCNCITRNNIRTCQTCQRIIGYEDCNCYCDQSVSNAVCSIVCGTCDTIQTTYAYNITTSMVQQVFTQNCGRDDLGCVNSWKQSHPLNTSATCWYDSTQPNNGAYLSKPKHTDNIAGLAFCIIFGVFMGLAFIGFLFNMEWAYQTSTKY